MPLSTTTKTTEPGKMTDTAGIILLVDDNTEDFEAARRAFQRVGLSNHLEHVLSGEAAIEYLRKPASIRPSLIILDLNMPGMGGHETLKIIKQDEKLKDIPVVMLSGSRSKLAIKTCYSLGANAYIVKSHDSNVLAANIKKLKEYWLDTVELPKIFDEEEARAKGDTTFAIMEEDAPEGSASTDMHHEVVLSPEDVYKKIMGPGPHKPINSITNITPAEIATLTWIARGKSRWEVGVILNISEDTVKARLEKIRQKLDASNTTHAIAIAILHGLLLDNNA